MRPPRVRYGFAPSQAEDHGRSCTSSGWTAGGARENRPAPPPHFLCTSRFHFGDCFCSRLVPSHIWTSWPPHAPERWPRPSVSQPLEVPWSPSPLRHSSISPPSPRASSHHPVTKAVTWQRRRHFQACPFQDLASSHLRQGWQCALKKEAAGTSP